MHLKFRGDLQRLKSCVGSTKLRGRWLKLLNGEREFHANNGGVLNWTPSTGSLWFRGVNRGTQELEERFKTAAKGRIEPHRLRLSVHLSQFEEKFDERHEDLEERCNDITETVDWLEYWMKELLDHLHVPDRYSDELDERARQRRAAQQRAQNNAPQDKKVPSGDESKKENSEGMRGGARIISINPFLEGS